jgi:hypothetical protein
MARYVNLDGVHTWYEQLGVGPPLVLLPTLAPIRRAPELG